MRKMMLLGVVCFAATVLTAGDNVQPLNIKTGLWQVTMTDTILGMGAPQTHSNTYKSCVTRENLNEYPFADRENHCTYNVRSSTGSHMDVSGSCLPEDGGTADFKIQLDAVDSENVTGTGQLTLAGPQGTLHGDYVGKSKWLSATCPPDVH